MEENISHNQEDDSINTDLHGIALSEINAVETDLKNMIDEMNTIDNYLNHDHSIDLHEKIRHSILGLQTDDQNIYDDKYSKKIPLSELGFDKIEGSSSMFSSSTNTPDSLESEDTEHCLKLNEYEIAKYENSLKEFKDYIPPQSSRIKKGQNEFISPSLQSVNNNSRKEQSNANNENIDLRKENCLLSRRIELEMNRAQKENARAKNAEHDLDRLRLILTKYFQNQKLDSTDTIDEILAITAQSMRLSLPMEGLSPSNKTNRKKKFPSSNVSVEKKNIRLEKENMELRTKLVTSAKEIDYRKQLYLQLVKKTKLVISKNQSNLVGTMRKVNYLQKEKIKLERKIEEQKKYIVKMEYFLLREGHTKQSLKKENRICSENLSNIVSSFEERLINNSNSKESSRSIAINTNISMENNEELFMEDDEFQNVDQTKDSDFGVPIKLPEYSPHASFAAENASSAAVDVHNYIPNHEFIAKANDVKSFKPSKNNNNYSSIERKMLNGIISENITEVEGNDNITKKLQKDFLKYYQQRKK